MKTKSVVLATVKVRFPPDGKSGDQVEITELVEDGWVLLKDHGPDGRPPLR